MSIEPISSTMQFVYVSNKEHLPQNVNYMM